MCDFCLSPVEVNYDYKAIAGALSHQKISEGPYTIWRYRDLFQELGYQGAGHLRGHPPMVANNGAPPTETGVGAGKAAI